MSYKIRYKLTDQNMQTKNHFQWKIGKIYKIDKTLQGIENNLCSIAWFHVYSHPLLSVLLNPIHANINNPKLFKCQCWGLHKTDQGLKEGFSAVKLLSKIKIPKITLIQKIAFGILCAKKNFYNDNWVKWADKWLKNIDRSYDSAYTTTAYIAVYAAYTAYTAYAAHAAVCAAINSNSINLIKLAKECLKY